MHFEELEKARKLIQQTTILSQTEKAEWIQLLPDMNDKQVFDLVKILSNPSKNVSAAPQQHLNQPHVDIKQKEIGTSIPFYEKELPAPHQTPVKPVEHVTPPVDPTELQNRVENIVREMHNKSVGRGPVLPPVKPLFHPAEHLPMVAFNQPEDFEKLFPSHLHGQEPNQQLQKVLEGMAAVGRGNRIFNAIEHFEKSPLYRTYIEMGIALLNDFSPDRDAAYALVTENMKKRGQQWLSKEELEAVADFRTRLEQMI